MRLSARYLLAVLITAVFCLPAWRIAHAQRVDQLPLLRQQMMQQKQSASPPPAIGQPSFVPPLQPQPVPEPVDTRIAAVVNDNVISTTDIENRMKIAFLSAGLPDTPEVRQKLIPQILRSLIEEQLQMQEAKRLDITVPKEDINAAMEHIASDNHIPMDMRTFVSSHGISPSSLENQIRAGLSWTRVVQRELRPLIEIGDDEVQSAMDRIRANAGKEEYLSSEIFLAVDNPKDEEQVHQFADKLVQEIKGGANFNAVARQFSQGTGAAAGGDIGWIQEGQLSPELNKALITMKGGEISEPIRTSNGYHILGVREKRTVSLGDSKEISVSLQQAFHAFVATDNKPELLSQADQIRKSFNSCPALKEGLTQKFPSWTWQDMGDVKLDHAPQWMADNVRNLAVGSGSEPIATDKGALIIFLCNKRVPDEASNRESVFNAIGTEKLELQARRLLRDLRRSAYLDIRLGKAPS
jgi:peptidyl-prolyl cis-trans isomerase SurA